MAVNYIFAVPLALYLELGKPAMGINGLWLAVSIGLVVITVVETLSFTIRSWDKCIVEPQEETASPTDPADRV